MPSNTDRAYRLNHVSRFSLGATGSPLRFNHTAVTERGFTLLEILAVIFIIGIIASFAGLSVGQKSSRVAQDEAERLYGLVRVAGEEAVLQGRELAVEFTRQSYYFLELNRDNQWNPVEGDALFRKREFPPDVNIELLVEGVAASFEDEKNLPRIFILSSGELTDFELSLGLEDEKAYTLRGTIDGKLDLSRAGESDIDV